MRHSAGGVLSAEKTSSGCLSCLKNASRSAARPHRVVMRSFVDVSLEHLLLTHLLSGKQDADGNRKIKTYWPGASRWLFCRQTRLV